MNSANEQQISSCLKGEDIAALGALGVASANQVDTLCVNKNVSSHLEGEHIWALGALGLGDWGWYMPIVNTPCENEHVSSCLKGEHIVGIGSIGEGNWAHPNKVDS